MSLKMFVFLIPKPVNVLPNMVKQVVIKLRNLKWEDYPGLFEWTGEIQGSLKRSKRVRFRHVVSETEARERFEEARLLALRMEEGDQNSKIMNVYATKLMVIC